MKKVFKLLILLFIPIIMLSVFTSKTYCSSSVLFPDGTYTIENYQNISTKKNFYNYSNISNVYYTNFLLPHLNNSIRLFSFKANSPIPNLNNGDNYINVYNLEVKAFDVVIGYYNGFINIWYDSSNYFCNIHYYLDFTPIDNVIVKPFGLGGISVDLLPFRNFYLQNLSYAEFPDALDFTVKFDIILNNQYFYNENFGLVCNIKPLFSNEFFNTYNQNIRHYINYSFFYNDGYYARKEYANISFEDLVMNQQDWYVIINNNYNYTDSYISSFEVSLYISGGTIYNGNSVTINDVYFKLQLFLSYDNPIDHLYLYSSTNSIDNVLNSGIIPNGSNDFYKSCEWWDIPTHLYNFLIYIIFDAPIISDFTNLAYVMIQFIVAVFEWMIALFNGISSSFFIAIFVGFIVLIFLLKIIFKG